MREKLKYALYRVLFTSLALLPFRVLYCISDGVRMILQHVMKYRRGVIRMKTKPIMNGTLSRCQRTMVLNTLSCGSDTGLNRERTFSMSRSNALS